MEQLKNKEKHTPGPWHVYRMGNYFGIDSGSESGTKENDRTIVAYGDDDNDMCGVRGDTTEEMMANARLIASAPELLEALERAKATMERDKNGGYRVDYNGNPAHEVGSTYVIVCNAIKKAYGTN